MLRSTLVARAGDFDEAHPGLKFHSARVLVDGLKYVVSVALKDTAALFTREKDRAPPRSRLMQAAAGEVRVLAFKAVHDAGP